MIKSVTFSDTVTKIVASLCSVHCNSTQLNVLCLYKSNKCFSTSSQLYNETKELLSESTCDENNDINEKSDAEYEKDIKHKILRASLSFVPVHGWTKAAINAGAVSIGYPGVVTEMFPLGGSNLVLYFLEQSNLQLKDYLKSKVETMLVDSDKQKWIKVFIADAIEFRLRMIIPYIDKWPQALATLTNPRAVPDALTNILTLVDDIAYYSGDRSADFDWYIRRVGIAGIYKVTELYMLQDKSPDYINTWEFLKRQLDDAVALYHYIQKSENATQFTKEFSSATFTTARNILGLNWNR